MNLLHKIYLRVIDLYYIFNSIKFWHIRLICYYITGFNLFTWRIGFFVWFTVFLISFKITLFINLHLLLNCQKHRFRSSVLSRRLNHIRFNNFFILLFFFKKLFFFSIYYIIYLWRIICSKWRLHQLSIGFFVKSKSLQQYFLNISWWILRRIDSSSQMENIWNIEYWLSSWICCAPANDSIH